MNRNENKHVIKEVYPGSIAEELEIEPGDILLSINHEKIGDIFDYRYLIKDNISKYSSEKPMARNGNWKLKKKTTMIWAWSLIMA